MNDSQLTQIRTYLLDRKLPIDILMEVQDHFVSQISDLERNENVDFEEAFEKVKKSWQGELKPYWDGGWDLQDNSKFLRRMYLSINLGVLKQTLKAGSAVILVLIVTAQLTHAALFKNLLTLTAVLLTFFPLIHYLLRRQDFMLATKYQKYVLTYYQHSAAIFFSTFAVFLPNIAEIYDHSEAVHHLFRFNTVPLQVESPVFFWIVFFFIIFGNMVVYVIQRNYLRQINKVKPFLKYLKPSS